jgi:histidinol-phosphate aminotransferase
MSLLPLLNPALSSIPAYALAPSPPEGVVRLASNENPYGPSRAVRLAVMEGLTTLHRYPDPSATALRRHIASHHALHADQVMVGNGATELLALIAKATLGPGQNCIYAKPSFVMYRIASVSMGAEVREVPLAADGGFDLQQICDQVDAHTKLVYLANPNNPTGSYLGAAALRAFVMALPAHVVLVLDEAYREYAVAHDFPDGLDLLGLRERMVVVRTFSKAYGLASMRVGYLCANAPVMDCLQRARLPFNVNALGQIAAVPALADVAHLARCRRKNRQEMERLVPALERFGCTVQPSQGNFLLVDLHHQSAVQELAERGVLVRSMKPYGLPTHARITIGTRNDHQALVDALHGVYALQRHRSAA